MGDNVVDEALQKAKDEIAKIKLNSKGYEDYKQQQSKEMVNHSAVLADRVLKQLISHTVSKDINYVFENVLKHTGSIFIEKKKTKTQTQSQKYVMQLAIVNKEYTLNMHELTEEKSVKRRMAFLFNTVNVCFVALKEYMKVWAEDHNIMFDYTLSMGENGTMFLDKNALKRIGITLKKVNKFPTEKH